MTEPTPGKIEIGKCKYCSEDNEALYPWRVAIDSVDYICHGYYEHALETQKAHMGND